MIYPLYNIFRKAKEQLLLDCQTLEKSQYILFTLLFDRTINFLIVSMRLILLNNRLKAFPLYFLLK